MLKRNLPAAAIMAALLFTGACSQESGSSDGQTLPVETLSVVTDQGSFDFDVEIADDEAERARDPREYARLEVVRGNRVRALEGLARLGRAEDRDFFEELAAAAEDLEVREAAMRALGTGK